jgi:hypothetical protein
MLSTIWNTSNANKLGRLCQGIGTCLLRVITCITNLHSLLLTQLVQLSNPRQKIPSHIAMVGWWMMFSIIIRQVCLTGLPMNSELPLLFPIQQPFKSHIHLFCMLWPDSGIYFPLRCQIIRLDGSMWLGVTHLMQNALHMHSFLCINK